jgi:hypothetical protein
LLWKQHPLFLVPGTTIGGIQGASIYVGRLGSLHRRSPRWKITSVCRCLNCRPPKWNLTEAQSLFEPRNNVAKKRKNSKSSGRDVKNEMHHYKRGKGRSSLEGTAILAENYLSNEAF